MREPGPALDDLVLRRVTALIGPYGSGKTELSLGLAQLVARRLQAGQAAWQRVALADLDVLKPYFRSREAGARLRSAGVDLLAPPGALAQSDLPILTAELRGSLLRQDTSLVLDVGGDPVGARALGSVSDVVGRTEHDLWLVINRHRPMQDPLDSLVRQAERIAEAARLPLTGLVANTHLLHETTLDDVLWGLEHARGLGARLGLPVRLLGVPEGLAGQVAGLPDLPPVLVVRRLMAPEFLGGVVLGRREPGKSLSEGACP